MKYPHLSWQAAPSLSSSAIEEAQRRMWRDLERTGSPLFCNQILEQGLPDSYCQFVAARQREELERGTISVLGKADRDNRSLLAFTFQVSSSTTSSNALNPNTAEFVEDLFLGLMARETAIKRVIGGSVPKRWTFANGAKQWELVIRAIAVVDGANGQAYYALARGLSKGGSPIPLSRVALRWVYDPLGSVANIYRHLQWTGGEGARYVGGGDGCYRVKEASLTLDETAELLLSFGSYGPQHRVFDIRAGRAGQITRQARLADAPLRHFRVVGLLPN